MKAKIAFLYGPGDLRVEEVELPALKSDQVLIKMHAVGICGSDVECFEGESAEGRYDIAPYTPGHEWAGEVVEIGSAVTSIKVGNKVTGDCVMACGRCENCKNGLMPSACLNMRELGFRPDSPGAMGEYMILEEEYTHAIPDDWAYTLGAWVETFSVGYWGLWGNGGYLDASDDVVVIGAGPIGLSAIVTAKASNAKVIVIDPLESRRQTAIQFGADEVVDPTNGDLVQNIKNLTDGKGPSVIAECSGNDRGIASVFDIAGHSCRVGFVGHSIGRKVSAELGKVIWSNLRIVGSGGTKTFLPRTIKFFSRIKDSYDFETLNTHYFTFDKIHDAFHVACHDKANARKVMITFE
ncbi:MAG: alcohol dehydrogenase catalytic domain-containing protein [Bacteroidetes bacterium]|nr:alcohol dehydrogenase catalytic domain-containing protein [Bacteroidota bacterium]